MIKSRGVRRTQKRRSCGANAVQYVHVYWNTEELKLWLVKLAVMPRLFDARPGVSRVEVTSTSSKHARTPIFLSDWLVLPCHLDEREMHMSTLIAPDSLTRDESNALSDMER